MSNERYEYHLDEYDEFNWFIIDNTTDEEYEYLEDVTRILNLQNSKITDLEAKLVEKEKEVSKWKYKKGKYVADRLTYISNITAIAELEKVKEYYISNVQWTRHKGMSMLEFIDQQIKSLKGDK